MFIYCEHSHASCFHVLNISKKNTGLLKIMNLKMSRCSLYTNFGNFRTTSTHWCRHNPKNLLRQARTPTYALCFQKFTFGCTISKWIFQYTYQVASGATGKFLELKELWLGEHLEGYGEPEDKIKLCAEHWRRLRQSVLIISLHFQGLLLLYVDRQWLVGIVFTQ